MPKCIECGDEYVTKQGGDIMISVCYECRKKPKPPDAYVNRGGLLVSNPEYEKWQNETKRLTK